MGHSVNATGYRLGISQRWSSKNFSPKKFFYHEFFNDQLFFDTYVLTCLIRNSTSILSRRCGFFCSHYDLLVHPGGEWRVLLYVYDRFLELYFLKIFLKSNFFSRNQTKKGYRFYLKNSKRFYSRKKRPAAMQRDKEFFKFFNRGSKFGIVVKYYLERSLNYFLNNFFNQQLSIDFKNNKFFCRKKVIVELVRLDCAHIPLKLMTTHIFNQLKRYVRLNRAYTKLFRYSKRNFSIQGMHLQVSGRFTRAERAASKLKKYGRVPYSSVEEKVSFFNHAIPLKYGATSIKIWVCFK